MGDRLAMESVTGLRGIRRPHSNERSKSPAVAMFPFAARAASIDSICERKRLIKS
jgi:hypothetical protein